MMFFAFCTEISTAMEYFIAGSSAAVSLYCGVKLPKRKRSARMVKIQGIGDVNHSDIPECIKQYLIKYIQSILHDRH